MGVLQLNLVDAKFNVGTINYAAGTFTITADTLVPQPVTAKVAAFDNLYIADNDVARMMKFNTLSGG